jgi:hypothetical protein
MKKMPRYEPLRKKPSADEKGAVHFDHILGDWDLARCPEKVVTEITSPVTELFTKWNALKESGWKSDLFMKLDESGKLVSTEEYERRQRESRVATVWPREYGGDWA